MNHQRQPEEAPTPFSTSNGTRPAEPEPRVKWKPPKEEGATLGDLRTRHEREYGPVWGPLKSKAEQARAQREMIAFDVARLMKGANDRKYNVKSHPGDFNDQYLCFYPATGYTLVTLDANLRDAVIEGGCPNPRIVEVGQAVECAEAWLATRPS